jgi:hypothetical protein
LPTWREQKLAQDKLQIEITPMISSQQSEVIHMLRVNPKLPMAAMYDTKMAHPSKRSKGVSS